MSTISKKENIAVVPTKAVIRKKFAGVVEGNKADKTVVVRVDRVKIAAKYGKRYTVSRRYQVHDEKNVCNVGDKVTFVECRPISKNKRWRITTN